MDVPTHGLLGGLLVHALYQKKSSKTAIAAAALGAMAPDLDVLIRSNHNPLFDLQYHRHFTHSFAFIPFGSLIIAVLFWLLLRRSHSFLQIFWATLIGFATHGLLDACTDYGTVLYWPFLNMRVAWNTISIVDPIFTALLLVGFLSGWKKKSMVVAPIFLMAAFLYLGFGFWQHANGLTIQHDLAAKRGHAIQKSRVMPSFANLILWRSIYEYEGRFYVDALRFSPFFKTSIFEGGSVRKVEFEELRKTIPEQSILLNELQICFWFAEGYVGRFSSNGAEFGDMRFSMVPNGLKPLWGIVYNESNPNSFVDYKLFIGEWRHALKPFWEMVQGR